MPGGMSSYLSCLQQHRKCQYAGNMINAANQESFPKRRCDYAQYNLLPSNKREGELTYDGCLQKRQKDSTVSWPAPRSTNSSVACVHVNASRSSAPFPLLFSRYSQPFAWPVFWVHLSAGVDPLRLRGQCAAAGQPAPPPGLRPAESTRPGLLNSHPHPTHTHFEIQLWTWTSSRFGGLSLSPL